MLRVNSVRRIIFADLTLAKRSVGSAKTIESPAGG